MTSKLFVWEDVPPLAAILAAVRKIDNAKLWQITDYSYETFLIVAATKKEARECFLKNYGGEDSIDENGTDLFRVVRWTD